MENDEKKLIPSEMSFFRTEGNSFQTINDMIGGGSENPSLWLQ
jgi:hypothetical protein